MGLNVKTIAKWRNRQMVEDARLAPKHVHSRSFRADEEAVVVAFRRDMLLPLDDCLYALQPNIPHLTQFLLHSCLQRHGISSLPQIEGDKPKKKFKRYPTGYVRIDIAELRTPVGKLHVFMAIDRTSKFAFVRLEKRLARWLPLNSREISSRRCPTRAARSSPITAFNS